MDKSDNTDMNIRVYRETTLPIIEKKSSTFCKTTKAEYQSAETKKPRKPRRDKSDLGEDFVASDGGWAWLVCIAAGTSNLCLYPCLQQFGFIFRVRSGMTSSKITTIINANPAISSRTGPLNGPMFRRFSFHRVALSGRLCTDKLRRAAGFLWTITGPGPVFVQYSVTFLHSIYGLLSMVIICVAISLHTTVSARIPQPVAG